VTQGIAGTALLDPQSIDNRGIHHCVGAPLARPAPHESRMRLLTGSSESTTTTSGRGSVASGNPYAMCALIPVRRRDSSPAYIGSTPIRRQWDPAIVRKAHLGGTLVPPVIGGCV
jgi:hypothetical protein